MTGRARRGLLAAFGFVLSGVLLWLALRNVDVPAARAAAEGADYAILSLALLGQVVGFGFMTARSRRLLGSFAPSSFARLFLSHLVGFAGNVILPFRMGELLRVEYIARHEQAEPPAVLAVVGLERLLDVFCLLLILAITFPLVVVDLPLGHSALPIAIVVVTALGGALVASQRPAMLTDSVAFVLKPLGSRVSDIVLPRARSFAEGLSGMSSIWSVGAVLGWSAGYWVATLFNIQVWLWAFDLDLAWYAAPLVVVFTAFGTALPAAPGFVGAYHFAVVVALGLLGVDRDVAASVALVGHATAMVPAGLVSVPIVVADQLRRPALAGGG